MTESICETFFSFTMAYGPLDFVLHAFGTQRYMDFLIACVCMSYLITQELITHLLCYVKHFTKRNEKAREEWKIVVWNQFNAKPQTKTKSGRENI